MLYIPGMAPLNNEEVINPKTKNIRLYVKRVFISDDFDGELVRTCYVAVRLVGLFLLFLVSSISPKVINRYQFDAPAVSKILELCEGCGGLG